MRGLSYLFLFFLIIGGLNWGIIGITPSWFNVVNWLSPHPWIDRIVYWIVGFSAIWWIFMWRSMFSSRNPGQKRP